MKKVVKLTGNSLEFCLLNSRSNIDYGENNYLSIVKKTKIGKSASKFVCINYFSYIVLSELDLINMGNKRTYQVNDSFFSELSEKSAYWLGFLYADGYISKTENCIRITLSEKDENHLLKFKKDTQSESPITYHMNRYSEKYPLTKKARISIFSKQIKQDLFNLGCSSSKSLICTFPNLSKELIPHFIRGYFDGDGSVYIIKASGRMKNPGIGCSIIGNLEFMEVLREKLSFNKEKALRQDKRLTVNIRTLEFAGFNIVDKFYNFIYNNATIYLDRKKEIFDKYKQRRSETIIQPS